MTKDLEEFGGARVYGINFDSDSDHIKDDLKAVGYGATKPVASNDTELGRAQNRRVELTKQ